jgi:hypothetical protein
MSRVAVGEPVTDQDRAAGCHSSDLGFEVVDEAQIGPTMRWVQLRSGDEFTTLTLTTWFETMPAGSITVLVIDVDNPDATRAKMLAYDIECSELDAEPWSRYFTAKDPDGLASSSPRRPRATHRPGAPRSANTMISPV